MGMVTIRGAVNVTPEGVPVSKYGLHLLREVGDVLRIVDQPRDRVRQAVGFWQKKTGQRLFVAQRGGGPVWVLRVE